jgi:voltage-gated potassium channel
MVLTVAAACEMAHRWVDAVRWTCLIYFVLERLVRLRYMARQGRPSL